MCRGERGGLFQRQLLAVHAQIAERAGGSLRDQDVDQLTRARPGIEHAGLHHHLFPAGRVPFGPRDEDVVEERPAPHRAGVREMRHARLVEPVIAVRAHHLGVAIVHLGEELERTG